MPVPPRPTGALRATPVAAVLLDDHALAVRARTTLAAADLATVVGAAPTGVRVRVRDQDGEPWLDGLPAAFDEWVERSRRLTLVLAPRTPDGVWLVLDGVLRRRRRPRGGSVPGGDSGPVPGGESGPVPGGDDVGVVLAVDGVWIGCPHGHGHARVLDLHAYATAAPDPVAAAAPRLVEHANAAHADRLRTLAASRSGLAAGDVAAADLTDLDATGVTLRVVDLDGGHDVRIPFGRPVHDGHALLTALRRALLGAS